MPGILISNEKSYYTKTGAFRNIIEDVISVEADGSGEFLQVQLDKLEGFLLDVRLQFATGAEKPDNVDIAIYDSHNVDILAGKGAGFTDNAMIQVAPPIAVHAPLSVAISGNTVANAKLLVIIHAF